MNVHALAKPHVENVHFYSCNYYCYIIIIVVALVYG